MAISEVADLLEHQLFRQQDGRDPLGVWVVRHVVTGDASGGSIKVGMQVQRTSSPGRIYTAYHLMVAGLTGAIPDDSLKTRLLTNFPPATPGGGTAGFATLRIVDTTGVVTDTTLTAPNFGPRDNMLSPLDRFILLFGPQFAQTAVNIAEVEIGGNVDLATYSFEGYGYFWDRQVLNFPGGPRHPGAN